MGFALKPGLLGADGVHLSEKRKSLFGHRLAKLVNRAFKLELAGEGNLNSSCSSQFDSSVNNRYTEPGEGSQITKKALKEQHKGLLATPVCKSASSGAQLKCLPANEHSMGNEQEESETYTHLQGCGLAGIIKRWWGSSHD